MNTLTVQKELKDNVVVVRLSGVIHEGANFPKNVGKLVGQVVVSTKGVQSINSDGIKQWIQFFGPLPAQGVGLKFVECSPPIVQQINAISNFIPLGAQVESIFLPFACPKCGPELMALYRVEVLKKSDLRLIPKLKCAGCGGLAVFDDIIEEYFLFLKRK